MHSTSSRLARNHSNHSRRIPGRTVSPSRAPAALAAFVAEVAGIDSSGRVLVRLPGSDEPAIARLLQGIDRSHLLASDGKGREALVILNGGRADKPIIIGLLESETAASAKFNEVEVCSSSRKERILVEALAELVLKCGAGSITLRKDGKIILRGTHLLSRSSGPIRIKGGHVEIN